MLYRPGLVGRLPCPQDWYFGSGPPAISDDFSSGLPTGWTFSRAGNNATNCLYSDSVSAPAFTTYVASTPRFLDFGLLMEPARTNYYLNSEAPVSQSPSLVVGTYTLWIHGPTSAVVTVTQGIGIITPSSGAALPGAPFTFQVTGPGTVVCTPSGGVVRIQLENGSSPTSYIQTTAATATRQADQLTKNYFTGPLNLSQGTYWVEFMWAQPNAMYPTSTEGNARIMTAGVGSLTSNVSTDQIVASSAGATNRMASNTYNAGGTNVTGALVTPPKPFGNVSRVAMSVDANSAQVAMDYVLGTRVSNSSNFRPDLLIAVTLGCGGGTPSIFNGFIRGFRYWPVAMPDAELKECTGAGYFGGPPVFNLDLRTQLPRIMTFARQATTGVATDSYSTDAPGSTYNTFAGPPAPRFSSRGLMMEAGRNNYFPLGNAPITRASISIGANQGYKLWIIGTGSVTVSPGTTTPDTAGNGGVATQGNPLFVQCTVAGTVTLTVAGTVNRAQLEQVGGNAVNGAVTSFIQNTTALQTRGAENLSLPVGPWWSQTGRTYYIEVFIEGLNFNGAFIVCGSADGAEREQIFISNNTTPGNPYTIIFETQWPGNFDPSMNYTTTQGHMIYKFALSTTQYRRASSMNGQFLAVPTNGLLKPQAVLMSFNTGLQQLTAAFGANVYRRITVWDYALSDDQLIALTT